MVLKQRTQKGERNRLKKKSKEIRDRNCSTCLLNRSIKLVRYRLIYKELRISV